MSPAIFGTEAMQVGRGVQTAVVMSSTSSAEPFTGISTVTAAGTFGMADVGAGIAVVVGAGVGVGAGERVGATVSGGGGVAAGPHPATTSSARMANEVVRNINDPPCLFGHPIPMPPTVARAIGDRLRAAGIRYVYGHPGGEVVDLMEGFREAGLEFVLTKHEAAAAFMAEATATSAGVPGVCLATLGPGATNLVTGVAHAYLDRGAVLAFSGQLPADRYEIATHQRLDLGALFAPITKWHARLTARNATAVVDRALRVATRRRPGPVYLEVPSDVPRLEVPVAGDASEEIAPQAEPTLDPAAVAEALGRLRRSRRPVILAGIDALDDAVVAPLRRFAERWSIPVLVGPKAKGLLREDHALFLGTIEGLGTA